MVVDILVGILVGILLHLHKDMLHHLHIGLEVGEDLHHNHHHHRRDNYSVIEIETMKAYITI
jgi:hypothetical protein